MRSPAWLLFVALPSVMAIANKSAPLILVLAAVMASVAAFGRDARALTGRYQMVLRAPMSQVVAALFCLAVVSLLWSIDPSATRRGLVECLPELLAALALAAAWPMVESGRAVALLRYGLLAGSAIVLVEATTGMHAHRLVGTRAETYDLKRSAAALAVLLWPALAACVAFASRTWAVVLVGAALVAAVAAGASASAVAIGVSVVVVALAHRWPRAAFAGICLAGFAALAAAPLTGTLMSALLPPQSRSYLARQHADIRLDMWTNFETHIRERWLFGHGFNASQAVSTSPKLDHARDIDMVWNVHPHNFLLQTWVEFGVLGALAAALCFGYLMLRLARLKGTDRAMRLGFLACAGTIALVGNSAWAPWWLATCAAGLLGFHLLEAGRDGRVGYPRPPPNRSKRLVEAGRR